MAQWAVRDQTPLFAELKRLTDKLSKLQQSDANRAAIITNIDAQIDLMVKDRRTTRTKDSETDIMRDRRNLSTPAKNVELEKAKQTDIDCAIAMMPHRIKPQPLPNASRHGPLPVNSTPTYNTPEYLESEYTSLIRQTIQQAAIHAAQINKESPDHVFAQYAYQEALTADTEYLKAVTRAMVEEMVTIPTSDVKELTNILKTAQRPFEEFSMGHWNLKQIYPLLEDIPHREPN